MKWGLVILAYLLTSKMDRGYELTLLVQNIYSSKGNVMIAIYNNEEGFMMPEKSFKNLIMPAQKGTMEMHLDHLPAGKYAIAVYHDANSNGKLDKNFFGVPTEYYGFSNNARGSFGAPSFSECCFMVSKNQNMSIALK